MVPHGVYGSVDGLVRAWRLPGHRRRDSPVCSTPVAYHLDFPQMSKSGGRTFGLPLSGAQNGDLASLPDPYMTESRVRLQIAPRVACNPSDGATRRNDVV